MEITVVPMWISEIAPTSIRGILGNATGISVNLGYITASWLGVGFYYAHETGTTIWRAPLAIGCLPCIEDIICVPFLPESPRYLLLQDETEKARGIVKSLHSKDDDPIHAYATAEFCQMQTQLAFEKSSDSSWLALWQRPSCLDYGTILYSGLGYNTGETLIL